MRRAQSARRCGRRNLGRKRQGRTRLPAATATGVTGRLMSFEDLFDAVVGGERGRTAA
jgi:hypothetical protein